MRAVPYQRGKRLTAIAAVFLAAAVVVASAFAAPPPIKGGVSCKLSVKKSMRLGPVLRNGLPSKITCDGPARFRTILEFAVPSKQDDDLLQMFPGGLPGIARGAKQGPTELKQAGGKTVRAVFLPYAKRIMKRYRKSKIIVIPVFERDDGSFVSVPKQVKRTVLVR
jgi:hypothetical protein